MSKSTLYIRKLNKTTKK